MSRAGPAHPRYDVVIVGAGPNGLAAAIALARAGLSTLLVEGKGSPGGGARTQALTLPGFFHDVCSTVHPLGVASPFFRSLNLERHGLSWIESPSALAHVLDEETVVTLERSIEATAAQLGPDAAAYRGLMQPFVARFDRLVEMILGPLRLPSAPLLMAQLGWYGLRSMAALARDCFTDHRAGALLAGIAAHSMVPLEGAATASFALVLAAAGHAVGWPVARGGSQALTNALVAAYRQLGGELLLDTPVERLGQLPSARAYVFDVTPRQLLRIAGSELPAGYAARLARFRHGPGVYKMDWALEAPVPWRHPACARTFTVHLSGSLEQVAGAEAAVHQGRMASRPFILFVQPSLFDPTRAPPGQHIAWAYCHVPHGSAGDASRAIEDEIERFAPGFRRRIIGRACKSAPEMERYNPNYIGGDINGGLADLGQLFFRPMLKADPYATAAPNIFLCSSSTPPGGGVHGMCGYWAARSVLSRVFGREKDG